MANSQLPSISLFVSPPEAKKIILSTIRFSVRVVLFAELSKLDISTKINHEGSSDVCAPSESCKCPLGLYPVLAALSTSMLIQQGYNVTEISGDSLRYVVDTND